MFRKTLPPPPPPMLEWEHPTLFRYKCSCGALLEVVSQWYKSEEAFSHNLHLHLTACAHSIYSGKQPDSLENMMWPPPDEHGELPEWMKVPSVPRELNGSEPTLTPHDTPTRTNQTAPTQIVWPELDKVRRPEPVKEIAAAAEVTGINEITGITGPGEVPEIVSAERPPRPIMVPGLDVPPPPWNGWEPPTLVTTPPSTPLPLTRPLPPPRPLPPLVAVPAVPKATPKPIRPVRFGALGWLRHNFA